MSDWNRIHTFSFAHKIEYSAAIRMSQHYNNDKERALTCNVQWKEQDTDIVHNKVCLL